MFQGNGLFRYSPDASWPAELEQRGEQMGDEDKQFSHGALPYQSVQHSQDCDSSMTSPTMSNSRQTGSVLIKLKPVEIAAERDAADNVLLRLKRKQPPRRRCGAIIGIENELWPGVT